MRDLAFVNQFIGDLKSKIRSNSTKAVYFRFRNCYEICLNSKPNVGHLKFFLIGQTPNANLVILIRLNRGGVWHCTIRARLLGLALGNL